MALMLCIGALPFVFNAHAYALENAAPSEVSSEKEANPWLDDYSKPVGFTYGSSAVVQSTYIWRALYAGATNVQFDASIGYGGLYATMWWSMGVTDWSFKKFLPELDLMLGFNRWGLNVFLLYIHNFDCPFFDAHNYVGKGNRLEVDVRYTISSKLPLSFLWATRFAASDGYINAAGDTVHAHSSYAEISYTQKFPYGLSLYGAIGITPWRSCYTHYMLDFAVQNVEIKLRKDWEVSPRCGMMLTGQLTISPSMLAADKSTAQWLPFSPEMQAINANVGVGVYLK